MSLRFLVVLSISIAAGARAADDPTLRKFDPDPARLALSLEGGFTTETAGAAPRSTLRFGAIFDYANGLLVLQQGAQRQDLLVSRGQLQLLAAYSLGRVELAAELPIALWQNSDFSFLTAQGVTGSLVDPIASTTIGDLRLGAKVPILDPASWPIGVAALADLRLPTGNAQAFMSDGLALVPSLILTRSIWRIRLDAQGGYQIRGQGQYAQLVVHDGWVYALGASIDLPKAGRLERWKAILELDGGWPRGESLSNDRHRAPFSVRGGLRAFLTPRVAVEAVLRTGHGELGYGHKPGGMFAGIRFAWPSPAAPAPPFVGAKMDRDGDGVPDDEDLCPDEPGKLEMDGCPDSDGDGI